MGVAVGVGLPDAMAILGRAVCAKRLTHAIGLAESVG